MLGDLSLRNRDFKVKKQFSDTKRSWILTAAVFVLFWFFAL